MSALASLFSTPKAPKPVDPQTQINAQNSAINTSAEKQQAYNRPNQTNAYGSTSSWTQTGTDANGNPIFSQQTNWGQPTQDFNTGLMGLGGQYINRAQSMLDNPADLSSMPAFQQAQDFATSTLDRQFQLQKDALDNKLKNQGLQPGTEAYDNAMRSTLDAQGDQRNSLISSIQNQLWNQNLGAAQFGTNQLTQLANPGIQAGFQGMNAGFTPVPGINVGTVDAMGAYNNNFNQQMQNYNAKMQQQNAMMGALGQLGGLALGGPIGGALMGGLSGLGSALNPYNSMGAAG